LIRHKKRVSKFKKSSIKKIFILIFIIAVLSLVAYALGFSNLSQLIQNTEKIMYQTTTSVIEVTTSTTSENVGGIGTTQQTTTSTTPTGQFQPSKVTLEIKGWGFNPNIITLMMGSTATWTNLDNKKHTVTSEGNFDSGDIEVGESWTHTFNSPGTYEYRCKYSGFTATVIIE